jgi:hypothetical protein
MQESYALSVEKRLQASENWKVLAKQIAEEVEKSIETQLEVADGTHWLGKIEEEKENHNLGPVYIYLTWTGLHLAVRCIPLSQPS